MLDGDLVGSGDEGSEWIAKMCCMNRHCWVMRVWGGIVIVDIGDQSMVCDGNEDNRLVTVN